MKISSNLTSLILKLTGLVLIISSIVQYIFSFFPSQWSDPNWQINLINGLVDQGITPLAGFGFLFTAWWIEDHNQETKSSTPIRLSALALSCLLGLLFLLLIPPYLGTVNRISNNLITQINQRAAQQKAQIQGSFAQLEALSQEPERLKTTLTQEIEQINQVLASGGVIQGQQLGAEQMQLLSTQKEQFEQILNLSENPEQLKAALVEQKSKVEAELAETENKEKDKAQNLALQRSLNTSTRSLILAIAYTVIGWFGFREKNSTTS